LVDIECGEVVHYCKPAHDGIITLYTWQNMIKIVMHCPQKMIEIVRHLFILEVWKETKTTHEVYTNINSSHFLYHFKDFNHVHNIMITK
jgi:hypothetical protein